MSENTLIKLVPNFVDKALEEPAREVGRLLGNIFYSVFSPINFPMEKYRLRKTIELEQYEEEIRTEVSKIPEENLIEPELNIVGPALNASKYYISNEKHRKMFAKLIARSMDKEQANQVHPAAIEIIKQLSPMDAKLFESMFTETRIQLPKIKVRLEVSEFDSTGQTIFSSYLPSRFYSDDFYYLESVRSLENLERLKLITISDQEIAYSDLDRTLGRKDTYEQIIEEAPLQNVTSASYAPHLKYQRVIKGHIAITEFGNMFYNSVI